MDWSLLWREVLDWRKYFTVRGCLTPLILGFAPSLWDVLSDYDYAATWPEGTKDKPRDPRVMPRGYLYLFICLPVTMLVLAQLSREAEGSLNRICCNCCSGCCCTVLKYFLKCVMTIGLLYVATFTASYLPNWLKYLSFACATALLSLKFMGVLVQGPTMKRLGILATSYESTYEAALQTFVVLYGALALNHPVDATTISCLLSSLFTVAKAGIEALLTFGIEDKMADAPFAFKLLQIARYGPVFAVTTMHRVTGLLAVHFVDFGDSPDASSFTLLLAALPHFMSMLALILSKSCFLQDILLSELLVGVIGEMFTITIWGRRGREGSRNLQLIFFLFHFTLHTSVLLYVINTGGDSFLKADPSIFQGFCIAGLSCGLLSLPLFLGRSMPWTMSAP